MRPTTLTITEKKITIEFLPSEQFLVWQAIFYTYKFKKLWNKTLEPYGWLKANTAREYWILFCIGHPPSCQACISSPPIHHVLNWICLFCTLCILFLKNIIDFSVTKSLKEFSMLFFTTIKSQTRVFLFLKCACPLLYLYWRLLY